MLCFVTLVWDSPFCLTTEDKGLCETSRTELFEKLFTVFRPSTILTKNLTLDVLRGPESVSLLHENSCIVRKKYHFIIAESLEVIKL